jgi:hypothetical protein
MARMKKQNENEKWKNENEKLAKPKTQKGGLGKNEHPAGLTTCEGNSGKNGATKRMCSWWIENPKGRFRQKWDWKVKKWKTEWKNEKWKMKNDMKSIDHRCEHPIFTQHWRA